MPISVLAPLLVQYGLPLVQKVWAMYQNPNQPLTQADFDELVKIAQYRSADSLAAAGIGIVDGKIVKLT